MLLETRPIVFAGVGAALVGVVQQARLRAAPLQRHVERPQREMPVVDGAQRPADDEARVEIQDGREIELGAAGDDELARVADPALIGPLGRELPVEDIGGDRLIVLAHRGPLEPLARTAAQAVRLHQSARRACD